MQETLSIAVLTPVWHT